MSDRWKKYLEDAGAVMDGDGRVLHFGNPSREQRVAMTGSVIADLSHRGLFTVAGPDAEKFLQGQLTNDVTQVSDACSQLSGYCTPKGRLLAVMRIFLDDGGYRLQLPATLLERTVERLRKYVLMSKVTLTPAGDTLTTIGLSGPQCARELARVIDVVPAGVDEVVQRDGLTVVRVPGVHPRFEIHGPIAAIEKAWERLDVHAAPVGSQAWTLLDVVSGVPDIHPETVEAFIPQTINLDLLGAVSLSKGCYTGQEIVARLHYRGTVKRRMYLAHLAEGDPPRPGDPVHAAAGGEQAIGHVVSAAPAPEGGFLLLASVVQEHAVNGDLRLHHDGAGKIRLRDLPYLPVGPGD